MYTSSESHQESISNHFRELVACIEPQALRTYTPTQAVLARSAGIFHWTPEGRRLYDFTSGVLVANLGHNPTAWMRRFLANMSWPGPQDTGAAEDYFAALPMTAYNAVTPVEVEATTKLLGLLQSRPGGKRLQRVMWAASG